jgi:serine/threonine protein kinase
MGGVETYYGEEGLHLVLEYCAEGSLRSHLDREIVAVATAHRADETRSRQRSHHEGNEAAAAEVVAEEAAKKEEGLEAEGGSQECGFWGTQLPENEVTDFLCQLLAGLAYHHARGVVHEDLKVCSSSSSSHLFFFFLLLLTQRRDTHLHTQPDNILMRDRHTLCLGDFGLASFTSAYAPFPFESTPRVWSPTTSHHQPPATSHNARVLLSRGWPLVCFSFVCFSPLLSSVAHSKSSSSGNHGSPNYNPPGTPLLHLCLPPSLHSF